MKQPSYYGILTATIRYSKTLTDFEKILFSDITALSNHYGYCTAGNQYFAEIFGKAKGTISRSISNLERDGQLNIKIMFKKGTKEVVGRRIYPMSITDANNPLDNEYDSLQNNPKPKRKPKIQLENIDLPEWLNMEAWDKWVSYKKEKRQTLTGSTIVLQLKMLEKNKLVHDKIIIQSIENGWTGLFVLKNKSTDREPEEGSLGWFEMQKQNTFDVQVEET